MQTLLKLVVAIAAGSLLAGCGDENFTGSYRFKAPSSQRTMVLNVHGKEAEIFGEDGKEGRIKPLVKMRVTVKDKKLLLDDVNSSERLAMKRNVDEQSLDCLNCKVLGIQNEVVWKYDPKGPYNVDQLLKDQASKDEDALNAAMLNIQQKALEQAKLDNEASKLAPYEGDWVYQRTTEQAPLTIMTIWRKTQIKSWSFDFDSMDRRGQEIPRFEVSDAGLKIGDDPKTHLYTLSTDKKTLTCMDCKNPERWAKADPNKNLSDRRYARQMSGSPSA